MINTEIDAAGVATLTWDTPGRSQNVVNDASLQALGAALEAVFADPAVTGVILTSGKDTFCAGADLAMLRELAFGGQDAAALYEGLGALGGLLRRLEQGKKPVVAALNGTALGGGYEIALACHRRILADNPKARVGLPEVNLGLLPGAGGTQRLPRRIGVQPALMLLLEGKQLRPAEALAQGLVDEVAPPTELLDAAKRWLATKPAATQPWDRKDFKLPGGELEDPGVRQVFAVGNAMTVQKTFRNLPAPQAILSCVYNGCRLSIDRGLEVERRLFVSLLTDPVAGNLIRTGFFGVQEANKLARRPAGVPRSQPQAIGVLGAGLMGAGIALVAAKAGLSVFVLDVDQARADGALRYAAERLDGDVRKGRLTPEKHDAILARVRPGTDYAPLAGCDVVIEAVFEDRAIKAEVTRRAEAVMRPDAVFGSNTSTLPITGLAEASVRPDQFIGLHFFSPVEKMPLVEVILGQQTSDVALAHALDLVQALGKTPIVVRDSRGFYTSRVFATYVSEGLAMLGEGVLPALIENAGRMAGMPMPPLALADDIGLGLMAAIRRQTRLDLGDAAPQHPSQAVLEVMVDQLGRSGRRAGGGFYQGEGAERRLWTGLSEQFPPAAEQPEAAALVERFLIVQAVEAAKCVEEGVLLAPIDADVGALLGWGFAPWTGGPLSYIDTVGADRFVAKADALADQLGDRLRPGAALRGMAARGERFHSRG